MLLARGILNPDPRAQFVKDLDKFLTKMKSPTDKILIVGDFNEVLSNNQSGMDRIRQQHHLVDIMERKIGHSDFNTYKRGTTRIDYALGTPDLLPAVASAGYEPFEFRTKGDHRPLYIDFDTLALFGNPTYNIASPASRSLIATDVGNRETYIRAKYNYLDQHNFHQRLQAALARIPGDTTDHSLMEALDRDWLRASLHGEKMCKSRPPTAYSVEIARLRLERSLLRKMESQQRHRIDFSQGIQRLLHKLYHPFGLPLDFPTTLDFRRWVVDYSFLGDEIEKRARSHTKTLKTLVHCLHNSL
jgi:hypothetical protein